MESIQSVRDQFIHFLSLLEGHELVMREQVQTMKSRVAEQIQRLGDEVEKSHSLWNQFKPRAEIFTAQDDRLALVGLVKRTDQFGSINSDRTDQFGSDDIYIF